MPSSSTTYAPGMGGHASTAPVRSSPVAGPDRTPARRSEGRQQPAEEEQREGRDDHDEVVALRLAELRGRERQAERLLGQVADDERRPEQGEAGTDVAEPAGAALLREDEAGQGDERQGEGGQQREPVQPERRRLRGRGTALHREVEQVGGDAEDGGGNGGAAGCLAELVDGHRGLLSGSRGRVAAACAGRPAPSSVRGTTAASSVRTTPRTASARQRRAVRIELQDVALAAGVGGLLLLDLALVERPAQGVAVTAAAAVAIGLAFLVRRLLPLALAVTAGAVLVAQSAAGGQLTHMLSTAIAGMLVMFSTGLLLPRRPALVGAGGFLLASWSELLLTLPDDFSLLSDLVFTGLVVVGAPWLAGRALRERRIRADELQALAAQLAAEREQTAQLAVLDERTRIAREMHDVVAHSVSLMVVQAGAGRRMLDTDPARSREAMLAVEDAGRQALGELRRVLGVLRGSPSRTP